MGHQLFDQYSLLHFSVGVITYFWNIPFLYGFTIHFLFEILENTKHGIEFINTYIIEPGYFGWPGGKHKADTILNIIGDNIFYAFGYFIAYILDYLGRINKWYYTFGNLKRPLNL